MHIQTKHNYELPTPPPVPPAAHFDAASFEDAKPVQPLRRSRLAQNPSRLLRLGTAILAVFAILVLEIATMARLEKQINASSVTPENSETTAASDSSSADMVATDPASETAAKTAIGSVKPVRRHHAHHNLQPPPGVFEIDQQPLFGKPRARLVTVIQ